MSAEFLEIGQTGVGFCQLGVGGGDVGLLDKRLSAQQMEGPIGGPFDFVGYPDVSIIVTQYVWQAGFQMGGMQALNYLYGRNKPIEFNETAYYPFWYKGDKVGASRAEAWEFMVGGGASFNHLNSRFTAADPAGKTPDNEQILSALRNLRSSFRALTS